MDLGKSPLVDEELTAFPIEPVCKSKEWQVDQNMSIVKEFHYITFYKMIFFELMAYIQGFLSRAEGPLTDDTHSPAFWNLLVNKPASFIIES